MYVRNCVIKSMSISNLNDYSDDYGKFSFNCGINGDAIVGRQTSQIRNDVCIACASNESSSNMISVYSSQFGTFVLNCIGRNLIPAVAVPLK